MAQCHVSMGYTMLYHFITMSDCHNVSYVATIFYYRYAVVTTIYWYVVLLRSTIQNVLHDATVFWKNILYRGTECYKYMSWFGTVCYNHSIQPLSSSLHYVTTRCWTMVQYRNICYNNVLLLHPICHNCNIG